MLIKPAGPAPGFWQGILTGRGQIGSDDIETAEDLRAYAELLRENIGRLRRRPLQRLRSWMHLISSKTALGRALAAHVAGLALLLFVFHLAGQSAWAGDLTTGARKGLVWYPVDERLFYANAAAVAFAAAAALLFYPLRWAALRREYACEYYAFRELVRRDPGQWADQADTDQAHVDEAAGGDSSSAPAGAWTGADGGWCTVLGLPPSATIEEVKEAYRSLIKKTHPDRVHGLSPAFQRLAATETQKLNAALRQALLTASRSERSANSRGQAA
ncbi:MAG: J domain-containing protein [Xanthobacteraceae bacterium]